MTEMFVDPSSMLPGIFKILPQIDLLFRGTSYGTVMFGVTISGPRTVYESYWLANLSWSLAGITGIRS